MLDNKKLKRVLILASVGREYWGGMRQVELS